MKDPSPPVRASTLYVRQFRDRMRQQGLVKKDVWIRPEYAAELSAIERSLRQSDRDPALPPLPGGLPATAGWSVRTIQQALSQSSAVQQGRMEIDLIEGAEPSLHLSMREFGDLSVFLAVGGEQIIVEAYLWPVDQIRDPDAFNAHVLRTHKLIPLSTISLQDVGGVPSYTMFGALDTHSGLPSLMFEIETLAENAISATDAYAGFLKPFRTRGGTADA